MRFPHWVVALVAGVLVPVLGLLFGGVHPAASVAASLLGGGAALALLFIPELSAFLLVGAAITFGVGVLLTHALARAAVPVLAELPFGLCLAGLSALLGVLCAVVLARTRWPRTLRWFQRDDLVALLVLLPVLGSTFLVHGRNGYVAGESGRQEFHARGFVNGDTFTLFALVNAARTGNDQLPIPQRDPAVPAGLFGVSNSQTRLNPFAAGDPLEYPVLLHQALADVLNSTGGDIMRLALWLLVPVLVGVIAVSVLFAQRIFRDPHQQRLPLWSVPVLLGAFGSTWESFTYPQSHAFLTGIFLLFVLLLVLRDQSGVQGERIALRFAIGGLATILLFSNAVLGTAAVAIAVVANLLQAASRHWPIRDRVSGLVGAAILLAIFLLFPPGEGALGSLNVAYTAIPQFLTAAILSLLVLWALWEYQFLHRSLTLLGASVVLPALGLITLFGSSRDIVAENSPRFLFLLVLLGWPAVIPLLQRLADWWWRQVRHVEHTIAEHLVLWGGGAFALIVVLLPAVSSVAGTLDVLVRKPPKIVSADELAAFTWVRENLPPDAVLLRAPESLFSDARIAPLSLPAFTGRAQLRSEYWLSPEDEVSSLVRAFFQGRLGAPPGAAVLFCGPERSVCPAGDRPSLFESGAVRLYRL